MTTARTHDELQDLLGAYALDAVDPDEALAVEDHLRTCPRCRAEVEEHREVAALLVGGPGSEAPPELWARIAADLGDPPEPVPIEVAFARRRHRPRGLLVGLAAAAVLALLALLGGLVLDQRAQLDDLRASVATGEVGNQFRRALESPGSRVVTLAGEDDLTLPAVVEADGDGLLLADALPALDGGRTYQLWGTGSAEPISLGLLGDDPDDARFHVEDAFDGLAVTSEPARGSTAPTTDPVATGALA